MVLRLLGKKMEKKCLKYFKKWIAMKAYLKILLILTSVNNLYVIKNLFQDKTNSLSIQMIWCKCNNNICKWWTCGCTSKCIGNKCINSHNHNFTLNNIISSKIKCINKVLTIKLAINSHKWTLMFKTLVNNNNEIIIIIVIIKSKFFQFNSIIRMNSFRFLRKKLNFVIKSS